MICCVCVVALCIIISIPRLPYHFFFWLGNSKYWLDSIPARRHYSIGVLCNFILSNTMVIIVLLVFSTILLTKGFAISTLFYLCCIYLLFLLASFYFYFHSFQHPNSRSIPSAAQFTAILQNFLYWKNKHVRFLLYIFLFVCFVLFCLFFKRRRNGR